MPPLKLPSISAWCAQVTVNPDANNTTVFNKGTAKAFKGLMPTGGQHEPNSIVGANLLWKNAQKKEKKNITSEIINKIIPIRNPRETASVWNPWYVLSRTTSRHHWNIVKTTRTKPTIIPI